MQSVLENITLQNKNTFKAETVYIRLVNVIYYIHLRLNSVIYITIVFRYNLPKSSKNSTWVRIHSDVINLQIMSVWAITIVACKQSMGHVNMLSI